MARIVSDWRIDFMRAHPRLFDLMTDEPERSFGYPLCDAGWRDALERLCTRIEDAETGKPEEPTTRHAHSNIRSTNIYMPSAISWKLLLKAQAVPTRRNPLRKNGTKLSRRRHSRSHRPMAAVIRTGAKSAGSSRGLPSISAVLLRVCEPQNPSTHLSNSSSMTGGLGLSYLRSGCRERAQGKETSGSLKRVKRCKWLSHLQIRDLLGGEVGSHGLGANLQILVETARIVLLRAYYII